MYRRGQQHSTSCDTLHYHRETLATVELHALTGSHQATKIKFPDIPGRTEFPNFPESETPV